MHMQDPVRMCHHPRSLPSAKIPDVHCQAGCSTRLGFKALVHKSAKGALWAAVMLQLGFQIPLLALQLCEAGVVPEVLVLKRFHLTSDPCLAYTTTTHGDLELQTKLECVLDVRLLMRLGFTAANV